MPAEYLTTDFFITQSMRYRHSNVVHLMRGLGLDFLPLEVRQRRQLPLFFMVQVRSTPGQSDCLWDTYGQSDEFMPPSKVRQILLLKIARPIVYVQKYLIWCIKI